MRNLQYSLNIPRQKTTPNKGMVITTSTLKSYPEALVFGLGDLAYGRGEPVAFNDCYDPYWGAAKSRTWPAPGNHEYKSPGAYGYFDYWQERAGPDRAGYYALRSQNWLIFSLNSEIDASSGSAQAAWIKEMIKAKPDSCIGAFYHRPAYSTITRSGSEDAQRLFQIMADSGARFVLNGHNHFYERSKPLDGMGNPSEDGTINFIVGAGGKTTSEKIEPADFTDQLITNAAGVLKLDFSSDSVAWTYLTEQNTTESGMLSCG
ncbi:metallophosphoesterase family protein [Ruegeria arenilitoris]|uniref:metallophosphoesterase family protein n=1 Tax=Ruegeria arenilitoris TaxID=1173585 RepID=UPI00147D83EB|nr:metallophosphoesterase [Ruegeria arenilitoris]